MLVPGDRVERYDVEDLLGRGGMAAVYRVRHRTLGTLHALKVLTLTGPGIQERLIQEGRIQANLRHPNIVTVTDVVEVEGSPGLLMDFVPGWALDAYLEERGPLPISEVEHLFRGILAGVSHAHDRGTIHRDLKPANVLLGSNEGGFVPKITDFGLARVFEEEQQGVRHTRTGMAMGTPPYMSPEQIRDAKSVDLRTDIFALGCILYEMLGGVRAFPQHEMLDVFTAVTQGNYVRVEHLRPDVPWGMRLAIEGCLVAARDHRLADCAELLRTLTKPADRSTNRMPPTVTTWPGGSLVDSAHVTPTLSPPALLPPQSRPTPAGLPGGTITLSALDTPSALGEPLAPEGPDALPAAVSSGPPLDPPRSEALPPPRTPRTGPRLRMFTAVTVGLGIAGLAYVYAPRAAPRSPPGIAVSTEATTPDESAELTLTPDGREGVPVADPEPPGEAAPPSQPARSPDAGRTTSARAAPPAKDLPHAGSASVVVAAADAAPAMRSPSPPKSSSDSPTPATSAASAASATPATGAATKAPAAEGQLKFSSLPWSNVSVDGRATGRTPFNRPVNAGPHTIVLITAEGATKRQTLDVEGGAVTNWCWDFELSTECR